MAVVRSGLRTMRSDHEFSACRESPGRRHARRPRGRGVRARHRAVGLAAVRAVERVPGADTVTTMEAPTLWVGTIRLFLAGRR